MYLSKTIYPTHRVHLGCLQMNRVNCCCIRLLPRWLDNHRYLTLEKMYFPWASILRIYTPLYMSPELQAGFMAIAIPYYVHNYNRNMGS